MGPLLLFIGVFLHLTRSTHSAGGSPPPARKDADGAKFKSRVKVRAGDDVSIPCPLDREDPVREWRWVPRYPRCVTTGSTEVVLYSPSVQPSWEDATHPFHGRLVVVNNQRKLTLQNTSVNDSGTFYCVDEDKSSSVNLSVSHHHGAEAKAIEARVVWGIAGVLAAVLFILLMIGIYCCLRRPKMRTAESKKINGAMGDFKAAGRRHGGDEGATEESKAGSSIAQLPQGAEGHEEIHYSLLEFHMAEGRAETPRAPENSPVYSEVSRKT